MIEKASEIVSSFGSLPFIPIRMEFTAPVPDNWLEASAATPNGFVPFDRLVDGRAVRLNGFIDQTIAKPGNREATTWSLLATADTDLMAL